MKTSTFSNGFSDKYQGKRDVKAAWMITYNETGTVYESGHSISRAAAEKTAKGKLFINFHMTGRQFDIRAREEGTTPFQLRKKLQAENRLYAARFTIEIVSI